MPARCCSAAGRRELPRARTEGTLPRDWCEVHSDHTWSRGYNVMNLLSISSMIIDSLLDTDLYKFTMMQVVLHHFPGAQVEYVFRCRTEGVDLAPHAEEIRAGIAELCRLRFRDDELEYLRGLRFMKSDFVDFLGLFQFNEKYIQVKRVADQPGIEISIRGPWLHTILYA